MAPSFSTIAPKYVDGSGTQAAVDQWHDHRDQSKAIRFGYRKLDSIWMPASGQLNLLAGRPGSFKTTLAWNLATSLAQQGKKILWVNLEPSCAQMFEMFAARRARIPRGMLGPHGSQLSLSQQGDMNSAVEDFKRLPIIFHFQNADVHSVIERARKVKYDAVFIDYIQLLTVKGRMSAPERIEMVCYALRDFAHSGGPFIMALVQMNRSIERDDESERLPKLSDLAGSAALEATGDAVSFLFDVKRRGEMAHVSLYVVKNRIGPPDEFVTLNANGPLCDIHEMDTESVPVDRNQSKERERYP
jgi:replicative DNA helicase